MALSWTNDTYEDAQASPYSQYVNRPTIGWSDTFLGIPTDNWYKKIQSYADKVKELEYNEKQRLISRNETWSREDSQYQRLVEDMKKAGLNPYWLLANGTGSPTSSSSQTLSYGESATSKTSESKGKSFDVIKTLGIILAIMKFLA